MRYLIPISLSLCLATGCDTPKTQSSKPTLPEPQREPSSAELAKTMLEERVNQVEGQLRAAEDDAERAALARQRLVLTIAIAEVGRRIGAGEEQVDVDRLLTSVELMLDTGPRRRAAKTRASGGKLGGKGGPRFKPLAQDKKPANEELTEVGDGDEPSEREESGKKKAKPKPKRAATRSLETSLAEPDASADPSGGEGQREKARVEVESRPRGLMTAVQKRVPEMESCLGGIDDDVTLQVTVRLGAGGQVRLAKVRGVASREASCVSRVLKSVRVPDHDGGTRIVRFPLYFRP